MSHSHGAFQDAIEQAKTVAQLPERKMYASEAEMMKNQVPLAWRDYCAHLLIPLNRCRVDNMYLPWTCSEQKHAYEKCEYQDYLWRAKKRELLTKEALDKAAAVKK